MLNLTTPALLFPAISLLFLAYNNRFLSLAQLIRNLHAEYRSKGQETTLLQIANLRSRLRLIQYMETFGVTSFVLCVMCMLSLFVEAELVARILFGTALVCLMVSLLIALVEILTSAGALRVLLSEIEPGTTQEKQR